MGDGTTILVVDDSPVLLRTLGLVLERDGHDVHTAADGETAVELVQETTPAIIFLDALMPGVDGYEVCRRIRQLEGDGPRTHVIILTGSSDEHMRTQASDAGADDFMTKPFSPTEILERVRAVLEARG